jgi:hypothetical protein
MPRVERLLIQVCGTKKSSHHILYEKARRTPKLSGGIGCGDAVHRSTQVEVCAPCSVPYPGSGRAAEKKRRKKAVVLVDRWLLELSH